MKRVRFCDQVQIYHPVGTRTLLRLEQMACKPTPQDLRKANVKVISLPGKKTERLVKRLMQCKK